MRNPAMKKQRQTHFHPAWYSLVLWILFLMVFSAVSAIPNRIILAKSSLEVAELTQITFGDRPAGLAYGPAQSYFVSGLAGNAITYFSDPAVQTHFELSQPDSGPYDILVGADKQLWFSENQGGRIGRLDPSAQPGSQLTEYSLPNETDTPTQLAVGQFGDLWFTVYNSNRVGRIDADGEIAMLDLADGSKPLGITQDEMGQVWVTNWGSRRLLRVNPDGTEMKEFSMPSTVFRPTEIILDHQGNLWFLYDNLNKITRFNPLSEEFSEYDISSVSSSFVDISLGPDGNIWLLGTSTLGWFVPGDGGPLNYTEIPLLENIFEGEGRAQMMAGPENNMVFTVNSNDKIYELQLTATDLRDIQIVVTDLPPMVFEAGEFYVELELVNWSRQATGPLEFTLQLDDNILFLGFEADGAGICSESNGLVTCDAGSLMSGESKAVNLKLKTERIPEYRAERLLTFAVRPLDGDYLPTNNRQQRNLIIQEAIDYYNDFSVSAEPNLWSQTQISSMSDEGSYLGRFSNDNVTFTFQDLPPHDRVEICFQLYILGNWDGDQFEDPDINEEPIPIIGPDIWANYIDENRLLVASFSNQERFSQSFPENYREGNNFAQERARVIGDFDQNGVANDSRYDFCYTRVHNQPEFKTTFYGVNLSDLDDEMWAIDTVRAKIYYHAAYDWIYFPTLIR
jgi:streptogramin lyase